jgi:hypothetical protein
MKIVIIIIIGYLEKKEILKKIKILVLFLNSSYNNGNLFLGEDFEAVENSR